MTVEVMALAAAVATLFVSVVAIAYHVFVRKSTADREALKRMAKMELKVDTLWDIYGLDALREARVGGLTDRHSLEKPSSKWASIVPLDVMSNMEQMITESNSYLSPEDLTIEVWQSFRKVLADTAEDHGVSIRGMFGAVIVMCAGAYELDRA